MNILQKLMKRIRIYSANKRIYKTPLDLIIEANLKILSKVSRERTMSLNDVGDAIKKAYKRKYTKPRWRKLVVDGKVIHIYAYSMIPKNIWNLANQKGVKLTRATFNQRKPFIAIEKNKSWVQINQLQIGMRKQDLNFKGKHR